MRYSDSDVVSNLLDRQYLFPTALCSFLVLTSLALFTLLIGQGINIARNITSNERLNRSRYPWMKDAFGHPFNHYDQGILKNVLEFWHVPGFSKNYFQEFHGSQRIGNFEPEKQNSEKFRPLLPGPLNGSLTCDITLNSDPKISPYSEPKDNCEENILEEEIIRSRPPSPQKKIDAILLSRRPSMVTGLESEFEIGTGPGTGTGTGTHQTILKPSIPTLPLSIPSSSSSPFVSFSDPDPPSTPSKEAKEDSFFHSRPLSEKKSNFVLCSPSSSPAPSVSPFSSISNSTPKPSFYRHPLSVSLPLPDSKEFGSTSDSKSQILKSPHGWLRKSPSSWSRFQSSPDSKSDSQRTGLVFFSEKTAMSSMTLSTAELPTQYERKSEEDSVPFKASSSTSTSTLISSHSDDIICERSLSSASTSPTATTTGNTPKICPESPPPSQSQFSYLSIIPAKRRRHEIG